MERSFLGKGWTFPPVFDRVSGRVETAADQKDIEQSLRVLLGTRPGERLLHPRFGMNMDTLLFESISLSLLNRIRDQIETAIVLFEPRIRLLNVNLQDSTLEEGRVLVRIDYEIERTNSRYNFVFPFYINERTERV